MTKKQLYQDLFISKWIKIYRQKQENDCYCCCMEIALPFFYYVKITLAKPIRITIDKNKLERESNLLSRAAILRILSLFPRNESHSPEYISVLLKQKKYDLLNYMYNLAAFVSEDLKKYVDLHGFEEFCLKDNFDKELFDNFYNAIIRSNAPVENWVNLSAKNRNIANYAKVKLLNLRISRIKRLQKQYNFNLEYIEDYWSNGKYWCIKRNFEYLGKAYSWQTIIDYQGKEIITFANKSVEDITASGTVIFRDEYGKYRVKKLPDKGDNISTNISSREELKRVSWHKHWGYMDSSGKIMIPIIFDKAGEFCNGESIVAVNNKYCLIDRTGKQINTDSVTLKLPKILDRKEAIKLFRKILRKYPIILDKI